MGKLTGWSGTIISKAVRALAARLVQRQRIFVTTPWLWLFWCFVFSVNTLYCVYISALSGSTLVCRVIILLELSEVPPIEPEARSVRIQLAVRARCSVVGRRCRPQLGIAFRQLRNHCNYMLRYIASRNAAIGNTPELWHK